MYRPENITMLVSDTSGLLMEMPPAAPAVSVMLPAWTVPSAGSLMLIAVEAEFSVKAPLTFDAPTLSAVGRLDIPLLLSKVALPLLLKPTMP